MGVKNPKIRGRPFQKKKTLEGMEKKAEENKLKPNDVIPREKFSREEMEEKFLPLSKTVIEQLKPDPMPEIKEPKKDNDLIESLHFKRGNDILTITLKKTPSRQYRLQIFLNEEHEVRPQTFFGYNPAMSFWGLFKRLLEIK